MIHVLAARQVLCPVNNPLCKDLVPGNDNAPTDLLTMLMGFTLQLVFVGGGLLLLFFLLLAGFEWITSEGDKEKLAKAQKRMINAVIGMLILILAYSAWLILVHDILGIFGEGGSFILPTLRR